MPKSHRVRETDNPLGRKINEVMAEKAIAGDYAQLARIFDVATPSTYDWITHGRLGKERYQKLVEWSGKSLDWWFDISLRFDDTYGRVKDLPMEEARERLNSKPEKWPFTTSPRTIQALSDEDIAMIDGYIRGVVDSRKADARKSS